MSRLFPQVHKLVFFIGIALEDDERNIPTRCQQPWKWGVYTADVVGGAVSLKVCCMFIYNHPATLGTGYGARMLQLRTGEEEQEEDE